MRIIIDRQGCVGHARCQAVAPDLYPLDDAGYIETDGFEVPNGQEMAASRGARACPEKIIRTVNDPEGKDQPQEKI